MRKLFSEMTDFVLFGVMIVSGMFLASIFFPTVFSPRYTHLIGPTGNTYKIISRSMMKFADTEERALVVTYQPDGGATSDELANNADDIVKAIAQRADIPTYDAIVVAAHVVDRRIGFYTQAHNSKTTFKKDSSGQWVPNSEISRIASGNARSRRR